MSTIIYILAAILIFGVLIAVHEAGHFAAARACSVTVNEFSIGMGPTIVHRVDRHGTVISWRALPIGGFCAMAGEDEQSDDPHAFTNAALWRRFIILASGAAMNFLLGLVLIILCFTQAEGFAAPTITEFMDGCPYESEDGLQAGDTFLRINGRRVYFASDVSTYLARSADGTSNITVRRDGRRVTLTDYPITLCDYVDEDTGETVQKYGFYFGELETGLFSKLKYSWYCACDFVRMVWLGLEDMITGAVSVRQMSGVVGIVDVIAETGKASPTVYDAVLNIAYLSAFIAINLAVMNLLPLPALDGGRIFFLLINGVVFLLRGRQPNPKYEGIIHAAGLLLLLLLMALVMVNDIARIITGG